MRRIYLILIFYILIVACKNKDLDTNTKTIFKVDSSKIRKSQAIEILDEANSWMAKAVKKEISKKKVNSKIDPLMKNYLDLLKKMNKQDSTEVQDYRIRRINELIDLQIQQSK